MLWYLCKLYVFTYMYFSLFCISFVPFMHNELSKLCTHNKCTCRGTRTCIIIYMYVQIRMYACTNLYALYMYIYLSQKAGEAVLDNRAIMELVQRMRTNNALFAKWDSGLVHCTIRGSILAIWSKCTCTCIVYTCACMWVHTIYVHTYM